MEVPPAPSSGRLASTTEPRLGEDVRIVLHYLAPEQSSLLADVLDPVQRRLQRQLFKNALGILVVYSGSSAFGLSSEQHVPLTAAVFILPNFLFSATAGQLADKLEKGRLIRQIKLAEIGVMALAVVGFLLENTELLVAVLVLMGTQSAFFGPVKYGILPQILEDNALTGGNALVELAIYMAILGGTIVGGLLVTLTWQGQLLGVWLVCAGIIAIAGIGCGLSKRIPACAPRVPDLEVQFNPIRPTIEILRITARTRVVFLSVMGFTWFWAFGTAFLSLFPSYPKDILCGCEGVATLFPRPSPAGSPLARCYTNESGDDLSCLFYGCWGEHTDGVGHHGLVPPLDLTVGQGVIGRDPQVCVLKAVESTTVRGSGG